MIIAYYTIDHELNNQRSVRLNPITCLSADGVCEVVKKDQPKQLTLQKATKGSSGYDVMSAEEVIIMPGQTKLIRTGLKLSIPEGYEAQIRSRSGLASKHSLFVLNGVGTIDSDYTGEVKVLLANFGEYMYRVKIGDRIAQLVFCALPDIYLLKTDIILDNPERGSNGFGSSGIGEFINIIV